MTDIEKIDFLEKNISKLKQEVQKLRLVIKNYKYDSLTGLLRRSDFNDRFDELWYYHKEFGHRFILAMLDLNGLHELNRSVSFEAGDELIINVANQLKNSFEDSNIFRAGGDEFVILKRGNDVDGFIERLNTIDNIEYGVVTTQENYESEQEMFNRVDEIIISKKNKKGKREIIFN